MACVSPAETPSGRTQCEICGKTFTRAHNLRAHLNTHYDIRPFACCVCGRAFGRLHDQRRHEALHFASKSLACGCGRRFTRADAMTRHLRSAAGRECMAMMASAPTFPLWSRRAPAGRRRPFRDVQLRKLGGVAVRCLVEFISRRHVGVCLGTAYTIRSRVLFGGHVSERYCIPDGFHLVRLTMGKRTNALIERFECRLAACVGSRLIHLRA